MVRLGDVGETVATVPSLHVAAVPPEGAAVLMFPANVAFWLLSSVRAVVVLVRRIKLLAPVVVMYPTPELVSILKVLEPFSRN